MELPPGKLEAGKRLVAGIQDGDASEVHAALNAWPTLVNETYGNTPWLFRAAKLPSTEVINVLLDAGADVNARALSMQLNALHSAASKGHLDNVKLLHEKGATLDTDDLDRNPLVAAVHGGNVEVAQYLLDAGIDSTVTYKTRRPLPISALDFAWEMGAHDIARAIALHEANGDPQAAKARLEEAHRIALENTEEPVQE